MLAACACVQEGDVLVRHMREDMDATKRQYSSMLEELKTKLRW